MAWFPAENLARCRCRLLRSNKDLLNLDGESALRDTSVIARSKTRRAGRLHKRQLEQERSTGRWGPSRCSRVNGASAPNAAEHVVRPQRCT
jgi:hypothetical protein